MRLTANFTLAEFEKSQAATRLGIPNSVPEDKILSLQALAENVLQPVRDHFGPVIITSGYRSPELNEAIGGSSTSQHSQAEAADFEVIGVSNKEVAHWIADNCLFDQLILEFYTPGDPNSGWVHCSFDLEVCRKQVLTASRIEGKTVYAQGIED